MKQLIRHRRYSEAAFLRAQYLYQIELEDYAARLMTRKTTYLNNLHVAYDSPASWADHEGCRTFGFNTREDAQHFFDDQGGAWVKGGPAE